MIGKAASNIVVILSGLSFTFVGFILGCSGRHVYSKYQIYTYPGYPWQKPILGLQMLMLGVFLGGIFLIIFLRLIRRKLSSRQHLVASILSLTFSVGICWLGGYIGDRFFPTPESWRKRSALEKLLVPREESQDDLMTKQCPSGMLCNQ